jgi:ankyrin repeat protein
MDEMVHGMERLDRRLQRSENAKRLRNKLQTDLESVSGSQVKRVSSDQTVFSDQTDGDFPMRKMFENDQENAPPVSSLAEYKTLDGVGMALLPADIVDEVPALLRAAQAGNVQQVRALLSLGASPSPRLPDGRTALHFCAIYDDAETAEALVKYGADVNAKDDKQRTPFRIAVSSQSFGMAALLVRKGSEVEKSIHLLLDIIQTGSGPGFADFLAALRELWDDAGPFMVHEAIEYDDNAALGALLGGGFDPNRRDACGISPIHRAIIQRRKTAVEVLLRYGASSDDFLPPQTESLLKPDTIHWHRALLPPMLDCGITPLGTAGRAMHDIDMVRVLLEAGADPNFEHSDGK